MNETATTPPPFPVDWNVWHEEWRAWRKANLGASMQGNTPFRGLGKNFLADAILGVWKVGPDLCVELSELTMSIGTTTRYVGLTWARISTAGVNESACALTVDAWAEYEAPLVVAGVPATILRAIRLPAGTVVTLIDCRTYWPRVSVLVGDLPCMMQATCLPWRDVATTD